MSDMLDHALDWAKRGFHVFPCNPSVTKGMSKRPLVARDKDAAGNPIPKTGGFYKASRDEAVITDWWSRWPKALIGIRMGAEAGVWALDPDVPKEEGDADGLTAWRNLCAEYGFKPFTHAHLTPSGGEHLLFRWRDDRPITNAEGALGGSGINVRGEGGYVIAPPSALTDGRRYHFAEPLDAFRFMDAPDWLYDLIAEPRPDSEELEAATPELDNVINMAGRKAKRLGRYAAKALEDELRIMATTGRGRNGQLNRSAFNLGQLAGAGIISPDLIRERLMEAAKANGYVGKDGVAAALNSMESGLRAGMAKPREIPMGAAASGGGRSSSGTAARAVGPSEMGDEVEELVTEDSAALHFRGLYEGRLRFCHDTGAWFGWNGAIWQRNRTGLAFHYARDLVRELAEHESAKVKGITSKTSFASGVERYSRTDPTFAVTIECWDRDPFLLGTPGGTVDLQTGALIEPEPSDGITKLAAVAPADTIECPLWLRFLNESTGGDTGLIRFLQQWAGYCLTGDTREHALVFVYGPGGNGKSVFLNAITGILGDYATTAAMDTFTASKGDKHPTDLAMLRGARLVTASETEEGRAWAESRIKQMTGGDPVTARFMRQDFFTYKPQFKLLIVGNHQPVLRNVDDAARRRFNIVPFTRKPERPDRQLEEKLKAEWPGILRWMIEGCLDWQKSGLVRPESVTAATEAYFSDQDLFGQWLAEECELDPGNTYKSETSADLFASWRPYAEGAGEPAGSRKSFADNLQRRGFTPARVHGGVRLFRGVRLKPKQRFDNDD